MIEISMQKPGSMECSWHAMVNMSRRLGSPFTFEEIAAATPFQPGKGGICLDESAQGLTALGWAAFTVRFSADSDIVAAVGALLEGDWGVIIPHNMLNPDMEHAVTVQYVHQNRLHCLCSLQGEVEIPNQPRAHYKQGLSHIALVARP